MSRTAIARMLFILLLAALGCIGCSSCHPRSQPKVPPPLKLSQKPEEARAQLLKEVPMGTGIDEARKRYSSLGFTVFEREGDDFAARLDVQSTALVSCNWIVSVQGKNGSVDDVEVKVFFTGP